MGLYNKIIDIQKLNAAWQKVKKNKPAAGVDNISYEDFETNINVELKQLHMELVEHTYTCIPVKNVTIYKEEKARIIALYSMRDKVVQQSIAAELEKIYENGFTEFTYAYRPGKSALVALDMIADQVTKDLYVYALKIDIEHFFDTIDWNILKNQLIKRLFDNDVIKLIEDNSKTRMLDETGELVEKTMGIHQGSSIAPILSNIYLNEFDHWLATNNVFFIRYSDDILILGKDKDELVVLLNSIKNRLGQLGLAINEKKTVCIDLKEGVDFLGHHFSKEGKSIPQKAKNNLNNRLEMMWLTSQIPIEEKIKKASEIIGGWEQYFREEKEICSIFTFVTLLNQNCNDIHKKSELIKVRENIQNTYKDIAVYMAKIWSNYKEYDWELFEYEQFYGITKFCNKYSDTIRSELLKHYRKQIINEDTDLMVELMQLYTDVGEYEKASFWMDKKDKYKDNIVYTNIIDSSTKVDTTKVIINQLTAAKILKLFVGREDVYSEETIGFGKKRQNETQYMPLIENIIYEHLLGTKTIGTFIQRPNNTVKYIVIDVDVSKKVLIQYDRKSEQFKGYLEKAEKISNQILNLYHQFGIKGYKEYSGCRGFHVWLFFTEWIPVRYANMLCEIIEHKIMVDEDVTLEFFPNNSRIKPGKLGPTIKIPFGIHVKTGEQAFFIDETGTKVTNVNEFIDGIAKFPLNAIKNILSVENNIADTPSKKVDENIEQLGKINESIKEVLMKCNLMRYLCLKAVKTGYLSHFERLTVLYVFGHLGDDGKEFVHQIMGYTLNYQYNITEKFIKKLPEKPISCIKLREQYKNQTAEFGCSCNFKRTKNCYPSPVLHAISQANAVNENITIPTGRTLTKEKEQNVIDELNIHKRAQELATKILENKKQLRKLEQLISKVENELCKIFDEQNISCLEIEMGMLVRRKKEDGYEWVIEI